jgi:hypothetical protein
VNSERIIWEYCEQLYVHTFNKLCKWNNFVKDTIYPNSQVKTHSMNTFVLKELRASRVAAVEQLSVKNKALRSNPSTTTQKKKEFKKQ